ncbi:MAG: hypothetical protein ACKV2T_07480 [Kofleriaceae bacterium]
MKDSGLLGNVLPMRGFVLGLVLVATWGHLASARAEVCPPAVSLNGDSHATVAVGELLTARGIDVDGSNCKVLHAKLSERGSTIVIDVTQADGTTIQRVVDDTITAATVIESFTRTDVGDPLLATRPVPPPPVVTELEAKARPAPRPPRGVHLSTAIETSFGSDRTRWTGVHVGACVVLGPICAGGRVRGAGVTWDPWEGDIERRSTELLAGIDIPFAVRSWRFTPGFAAGLGHMQTSVAREGMRGIRVESGGVRADVHASLSIPLWRHLALDLFAAADLTQETRALDRSEIDETMIDIPDEPRLLLRFGIGLSYGGL